MNKDTLNAAIREAERFLKAANACQNAGEDHETLAHVRPYHAWTTYPPRESGACKRASMDLTRALADLRRPS
jgi:hypothetical protein